MSGVIRWPGLEGGYGYMILIFHKAYNEEYIEAHHVISLSDLDVQPRSLPATS
jgi:hypothetical protein